MVRKKAKNHTPITAPLCCSVLPTLFPCSTLVLVTGCHPSGHNLFQRGLSTVCDSFRYIHVLQCGVVIESPEIGDIKLRPWKTGHCDDAN